MIPKSNEIRIEVTTSCNYNCILCPREKLTRKIETMSFGLFKSIFDKINSETSQYNTLTFPGMGEPLLDESLDDKIIYAKKCGFSVLILTNGSLLTVERFERLEDIGVESIRVSMYGDSPESYNAVHGIKNKDLFHRIKQNLTSISKVKKNTKLLITYNVVEDYNESTVKSWIEYWKDKVDLLEVWRPHNWVDGRNYRVVGHEKLKTCGRPFNTPLQVQVDGTVNMCCFDFNGKLLLGDLKKQTLKEIFESSMFKKIVGCHTIGNFTGSGLICENCDQRNKDKSDVMIFNSKFDVKERVWKVSTTYQEVLTKG
ncbi:MAG: radical SAM protein [Candidatus Brocadia sp.]|jgi:wyosine [tRNA(Phe)-imidazoG37] synthetase (radical SAM superfamily)